MHCLAFLVALFAVASLAVYTFMAYRSAAVELLIRLLTGN